MWLLEHLKLHVWPDSVAFTLFCLHSADVVSCPFLVYLPELLEKQKYNPIIIMTFLVLSGALTLLFLGNLCNSPQHLPFPSPPALDKGSVLYSLNFINRSWLVFKTPCAFCLQCLFSSAPVPPTYPASPGLVKHSSFPFPLLIFLLLFPCGTVH